MNNDQLQGTLRQLVLTLAASSAGHDILDRFGISGNDVLGFFGVMGCLFAFAWQLAHHKETGDAGKQ